MILSKKIKDRVYNDFDFLVGVMLATRMKEAAIKIAIKSNYPSFANNYKLIEYLKSEGYSETEIFKHNEKDKKND